MDIETLIGDCFTMAREFGAKKKTDFESMDGRSFTSTPIVKEISRYGHSRVDGHFCISKKGILHYKDDVDAFRRMYFASNT